MSPAIPAVLLDWEDTIDQLLARTIRFPKAARFTFAQRIDGLALDVLEDLVEARFAPAMSKRDALLRADRRLARLRALVRVAHRRRYLDGGGYESVSRRLEVAGRMIGGWLRQGAARDPA